MSSLSRFAHLIKSPPNPVNLLITGLLACLLTTLTLAQAPGSHENLELTVKGDDYWWVGVVNHGDRMPLREAYQADFNSNYGNQVQPLMLSNKGEVIWSGHPWQLDFSGAKIRITGRVSYHREGGSLKEAYQFASRTYFPPSGKMPDPLLFTHPQYNTWIELMYDQNQQDILTYAQNILANGFPPGVLMIDDNWQEDYGKWLFHPGRFSDPQMMMEDLHAMGFKVMLWVCPFVSPDCDVYRDLAAKKYLVTDQTGEPAIVRWWNGASALLDLSNPQAFDWFKSRLDQLMADYGVDGFKFDAGDFEYYEGVGSFAPQTTPQEHSRLYGELGLSYPLNEYRAMWQMGGQPLAERLRDKGHGFGDLQVLIPNMLTAGLMGYAFSCPDMIGGGEFTSFLNEAVLDQESIVRSAQCHALMPMMQFSVAPWRVLDDRHLAAVKKAVMIREKFRAYILDLAQIAAQSGDPIMRPLEFTYPGMGFEKITDQFLLGDRLLVAPVLDKNAEKRSIVLPPGRWKGWNGQIHTGPQTVELNVGLEDLPYFELVD